MQPFVQRGRIDRQDIQVILSHLLDAVLHLNLPSAREGKSRNAVVQPMTGINRILFFYISSFGVRNQADCDDNRLNAQDICIDVQRKVEWSRQTTTCLIPQNQKRRLCRLRTPVSGGAMNADKPTEADRIDRALP